MEYASLIAEFVYRPRSESQTWELPKAVRVWQQEPDRNGLMRVT